jgi:DNA-binding transcriptional MerR regulator
MSERGVTIRKLLHNERRFYAFSSDICGFVEKNANALHKPIFTIKTSKSFVEGLTYRKVNVWDTKDLVTGSRENKGAGWRKFSISEAVILKIITDLRKVGFNTEKMKAVIEKICADYADSSETNAKVKRCFRFLQLEYNIFDCLCGNKILLLVEENESVSFLPEWAILGSRIHFDDDSPVLILPFFSYVQSIFAALKKDIRIETDSTFKHLVEQILSEKERRILELLKDKDYEEITITRKDGEEFAIRAKSRKRGSFSEKDIIKAIKSREYQNVTISRVGGEQIAIVRDETIKV